MKHWLVIILWGLVGNVFSQQIGDKSYQPKIKDPSFDIGLGPAIYVDKGHFNFHTIEGRYGAFANVLRADGYVVKSFDELFSDPTLDSIGCLVISNAINEINFNDWDPPHLSAFSKSEINAVYKWIINGGRLFLIADHQPFPGAAMELAAKLGIKFNNSFAMLDNGSDKTPQQYTVFSKEKETLAMHDITVDIDSIRTFTGQAFQTSENFQPIIIFPKGFKISMPIITWQFDEKTKKFDIQGWYQGAVAEIGKGKIAVFGEAAMFTAQTQNDQFVMGLGAPGAEQNQQFLLNVIKWLTNDL